MKLVNHNNFNEPEINKLYAVVAITSINWTELKKTRVALFSTFEEARDYFERFTNSKLKKYHNVNAENDYEYIEEKDQYGDITRYFFAGYVSDYSKIPMQTMMDI